MCLQLGVVAEDQNAVFDGIGEVVNGDVQFLYGAQHAIGLFAASDDGITFHGYGKVKEDANGPIDYAFVSKNVRVDRYKIIRNTVMDMYPSDHYPIIVDVMF